MLIQRNNPINCLVVPKWTALQFLAGCLIVSGDPMEQFFCCLLHFQAEIQMDGCKNKNSPQQKIMKYQRAIAKNLPHDKITPVVVS
jgi:hypothetical protein